MHGKAGNLKVQCRLISKNVRPVSLLLWRSIIKYSLSH